VLYTAAWSDRWVFFYTPPHLTLACRPVGGVERSLGLSVDLANYLRRSSSILVHQPSFGRATCSPADRQSD